MANLFKSLKRQVKEFPSIIFISFDIRKDEYPAMNYSIASLIASLKKRKIRISHYSIDLQHALFEKEYLQPITVPVMGRISNNLSYIKKFDFIAISLTSWTIEYCYYLLQELKDIGVSNSYH